MTHFETKRCRHCAEMFDSNGECPDCPERQDENCGECSDCAEEIASLSEREFDERCALGYT